MAEKLTMQVLADRIGKLERTLPADVATKDTLVTLIREYVIPAVNAHLAIKSQGIHLLGRNSERGLRLAHEARERLWNGLKDLSENFKRLERREITELLGLEGKVEDAGVIPRLGEAEIERRLGKLEHALFSHSSQFAEWAPPEETLGSAAGGQWKPKEEERGRVGFEIFEDGTVSLLKASGGITTHVGLTVDGICQYRASALFKYLRGLSETKGHLAGMRKKGEK